ncbi:MAG: winged helix-turn-helix domain-containing protein [Bryobacteraceae bacterium]
MKETKDIYCFGPFQADLRRRVLSRGDETIALPGKAFDVLAVLLGKAGVTVSKEEILEAVWADSFVEEGNLTQAVFVLRKALGETDGKPYILTVPRQGYRFVGEIETDRPVVEAAPVAAGGGKLRVAALCFVAGVVVALLGVGLRRPAGSGEGFAGPVRFEIPQRGGVYLAVSPDGGRLALIGTGREDSSSGRIRVRELSTGTEQELAGTENAAFAFWAPDSCCLGFFAQGKLKVARVGGGPVTVVADAPMGRGGTWSRDGRILFAPKPAGVLEVVAAAGGKPEAVTKLEAGQENSHRWPVFLPDGDGFLYMAHSPMPENRTIRFSRIGPNAAGKVLVRSDSNAVYVRWADGSGQLLYMVSGALMAQGFDAKGGQLTGEPRVVAKPVQQDAPLRLGMFSASANGGILAYVGQGAPGSRLRWFNREGKELGEVARSEGVWQLHLSQDGRIVAGAREDPEVGTGDIWTFDLGKGSANRITRHPAWESMPVLSPDGSQVVFASDRPPGNAFLKAVEGAGAEQELRPVGGQEGQRNPYDWSSDGKSIVYARLDGDNENLWLYDVETRREYPLLQGPFHESQGQLSADGRFLAYASDETGAPEIYVRRLMPGGKLGEKRVKVSVNGGVEPRWRRDGKELFYVGHGGELMAVALPGDETMRAGTPVMLFRSTLRFGFGWHSSFHYAVTGDGQRLLMVVEDRAAAGVPVTVVVNGMHGAR